jgi:glycosyltransferase involved in cell wall biosynthesis
MAPARPSPRRIGFISSRFSGTDGVSLETEKWAEVLEGLGHVCFYFAGESDRPSGRSWLVPEAHFQHPDILAINQEAFSSRQRSPGLSDNIQALKDKLKAELRRFVRDFEIELLIPENAITIPMNIPLGLAVTEFVIETGIPTIAHHHDFYWERQRFLTHCIPDILAAAFPPQIPGIHHVVINSLAGKQLSLRTGMSSLLIPNVMDFEHPPSPPDEYVADLHSAIGVRPDERIFLQPTRVVQRKGIEHAIELVKRLDLNACLVISHSAGDERDDYENRLREYADLLGVRVNFISDVIRHRRGKTEDGRKIYALEDVYLQADLVTYPSTIEGFGNAFLEAIYYRKPIVANSYSIYDIDIKPKGFQVIDFQGYITDATVEKTRRVLEEPGLAAEMAEHNYRLGKRFYSYAVLERNLETLLVECFGETTAQN